MRKSPMLVENVTDIAKTTTVSIAGVSLAQYLQTTNLIIALVIGIGTVIYTYSKIYFLFKEHCQNDKSNGHKFNS